MFSDFLQAHLSRVLPHESEDALEIPEYLPSMLVVPCVSLATIAEPPLGAPFVTFTEAVSR